MHKDKQTIHHLVWLLGVFCACNHTGVGYCLFVHGLPEPLPDKRKMPHTFVFIDLHSWGRGGKNISRATMYYTAGIAQEIDEKIRSGEISNDEANNLAEKLIEAIFEGYNNLFSRYGGGLVQSESQWVNHAYNAMKGLNLEFNDYNIFMAAIATGKIIIELYKDWKFPSEYLPDIAKCQTYNGIADIMTQIANFGNWA